MFWVIFVTYNIGIYICIYIYKVSYIHSFLLSSTVMFFLHCILSILRYEKIFFEIDEWIAWVLIANPFSLLWSIFFLSGELCFLQSPCLLLITESISLDTSFKPTVWFFLKISSSSRIILSVSLDELNSSHWLLKRWWWIFSWNNFYFIVVKY